MNAPTCGNPHDTRTCTLPTSHPLPHRDHLGTWINIDEFTPEEQHLIRAAWEDQ